MEMNINAKHPRWLEWSFVLGLIIAVILPRQLDSGRFTTIDEGLWLYRSANFYYALGQREFEYTHQSEHPGVTTMWAGALGYLTEFSEYRGMGQGYMENGFSLINFLKSTDKTEVDLIVAGRRFIVLGVTATLLLTYWITRKIIGFFPAIVGFLLIAFEPYPIGLTNILHLDGLLTSFMLLSSVSMILYLWKEPKRRYFLLSATAAGCSFLTKTPGVFMFPFVGLLLLIKNLKQKQDFLKGLITKIALPLIIWTLVALAVIVILWPAMWVKPIDTIQDVFGDMGHYLSGDAANFIDATEKNEAKQNWSFYPVNILWRKTPVVLAGILFAVLGFIKRWEPLGEKTTRRFVQSLILFAFFFIIMMTIGGLKADRYVLPIYPPLILISGLGWVTIANKTQSWLKTRTIHPAAKYTGTAILIGVICLQLIETVRTHPYYNTYYNPLMGGPEKASEAIQLGWGEGLDQVAAYLNTKPEADELSVLSTNAYGPLSFYFLGTAIQIPSRELSPEYLSEFDYIVIYVIQWQRGFQQPLLDALEGSEPEHVIYLNGLEYARIYNVIDFTLQEWEALLLIQY